MNMKRESGFTIIELMIAIAVGGVLLALAVPSFMTMIQNNRMTSSLNGFVGAIHVARSESIRRGSNIVICKSSSGTACTAGSQWEAGWLVFADTNANSSFDVGEDIILIGEALDQTLTLREAPTLTQVIYSGRGFAVGLAPTTFTICDARGSNDAKGLVLSSVGRLSRTEDTNGDTQEDVGGVNLVCP
ncbi:MAG: GspH/FimT family pseudopilin [Gammaproteobacteria bacterium]|nr:GspH/FimT family pseudopilin [Gammaproteobacteria bacterium]